MKNISIKGILLGIVSLMILDTLGDVLLRLALVGEVTGEPVDALQSDTLFLILRMFVGAAALVGAGYITEKLAKTSNLVNSGIVGAISVVITVLVLEESYPVWYLILSYLYQFPSAVAGGYIFNRNASFTSESTNEKT